MTIPRVVIVAYRPKPGKQGMLLALIRDHHPYLYSEGLATEMEPVIMRSADGAMIEVFEWASSAAIEQAHTHEGVQKMWARFAECCDYVPIGQLAEAGKIFSEFEPVEIRFQPSPQGAPDEREE